MSESEARVLVHVLVLDLAAEPGQDLHDPDDVLLRIVRLGQLNLHPAQVDECGAFGRQYDGPDVVKTTSGPKIDSILSRSFDAR